MARRFAMLVCHALSFALLLLFVLGIPYLSWLCADAEFDEGQRLHAYFVSTRGLTPGTQITAGDVEVRVGYVGPEASSLPARDIVGRFVVAPMAKGDMITNSSVSRRYEITAPQQQVIVQVQVDGEDAQGIAAGSIVALTREKAVHLKNNNDAAGEQSVIETLGLPDCASSEPKVLRVLSIAHSGEKGKPSLLRIALDQNLASLAPFLTLYTWKPIVLGDNACLR